MYRLVFCDLDGTLITYERKLHPAVREAMQAVVDAGLWITVSSGRGYQLLQPFVDLLVVNAPVVGCNGGLIVEPATRQVLYVKPMPLPMAHELVRWGNSEGVETWAYFDDMETMLEYRPWERGFVLRRFGVAAHQDGDPVVELTRPPHKLIFLPGAPERMPAVIEPLQQYLGERAHVMASSPNVVEVILPGISKANAMSWVAAHLGVNREETMAIGDGDNDVEMLDWAGWGVAMRNGSPAALAAADWVAPSVDEDGAAVALRRFVLGPDKGS